MWVTRSSSPTCLRNFHNKLQSPRSSRTCQNKQVISGQRVLSCHLSVKSCTKETVLIFVKIVLTTRNDPWRAYFYSVGCTFLALHFLWNNDFFGDMATKRPWMTTQTNIGPLVQLGWSICSIRFEVLPKSMKHAHTFAKLLCIYHAKALFLETKTRTTQECTRLSTLDKHKMLLEKHFRLALRGRACFNHRR